MSRSRGLGQGCTGRRESGDATVTLSGRPSNSGSRLASTVPLSGSRGVCSNACCRSGPPRSGPSRRLLFPTNPVREHRRAEAAPAPVDRGRECRDRRTRLALDGKRRCTLDRPHRRSRAMAAVSRRRGRSITCEGRGPSSAAIPQPRR
jgi:hypothetical protein